MIGKGKSGKRASSSSTIDAKAHKISAADDGSDKSLLAKSSKKNQSDNGDNIFSVDSDMLLCRTYECLHGKSGKSSSKKESILRSSKSSKKNTGLVLELNNNETVAAAAMMLEENTTIALSATPSSMPMPSYIDNIILAPVPLVIDRKCEYIKKETVNVEVTGNGVDNRIR